MTYRFKIPAALHQQRFDHATHALLNESIAGGISKAQVRKLVMVGAVYINGKRCRIASKPVWSGNELRIEYHPQNIAPHEKAAPFDSKSILYHEDDILIVNKPAGLPTVATVDNARDNLVEQIKNIFPYIGVHHRLDAPTSGLILFTTDEAVNPFAARLFQENLIHKEYLAVCTGGNPALGKKWEIKNQLVRAERKRNIYASTEALQRKQQLAAGAENTPLEKAGEGSFAYSRFEILGLRRERSLVGCEPVTGRTHQLRVHLAEFGMPIVGDRTYGGIQAPRLMLHAHRLSFRHPHEAREVIVEAPLPKDFDFTL